MNNLIKDLFWRGLIKNITPGLEEKLNQVPIILYVGFDPTSDSFHIGNLIPIIMLNRFKNYGHLPIVVIGGATGMIGDPSGKETSRSILNKNVLFENVNLLKKQLLNFIISKNIFNNYDWIKNFSLIEFIRNFGKHFTINYLITKFSIKQRIFNKNYNGISLPEFIYQIIQGYDFFYFFQKKKCLLQIGGSDQWGNIITGIELIRKKTSEEVYGLTFPLILKSDGKKFGKSVNGKNIWLDAKRTSPYEFFQYWINTSDQEAIKFIKMFTFLSKEKIEKIIIFHKEKPQERILQHKLAYELTIFVHGIKAYKNTLIVSQILFSKENLLFNKKTLIRLRKFIPNIKILYDNLKMGIPILEIFLKLGFSKHSAIRNFKANAISINRKKVNENFIFKENLLFNKNYFMLKIGKNIFFIIEII